MSLQNYFLKHPEYPWLPDRAKTSMFIQSDFAVDSRYQDVDPCVVVEGGNITYSQAGLTNNMVNFTLDNMYQMTSYHQFLAESSINIHCIATASDAAEELGFEVAMFLQSMRLIAADMIQLQSMTMPQQSKAQLMMRQEWSGKFDSVVSFGYNFAIKRKHTPLDPGLLLQEIEFYLRHPITDPFPGHVDGNGNPINDNGGKGGTNTGGQSGNWGGNGGNGNNGGGNGSADGIDDGYVTLEMKINKDTITEEQD